MVFVVISFRNAVNLSKCEVLKVWRVDGQFEYDKTHVQNLWNWSAAQGRFY